MNKDKLIKSINDNIPHLSREDLIAIAHIVDPVVDIKSKIYKEDGLYILYDAIDIDTLRRIYNFIAEKLSI